MGGAESKKSKLKNEKNTSGMPVTTRGNVQNDIKDVLLLYRASDKKQRQVVRSFRDALIRTGQPQINICDEIDIARDVTSVKDLEWLTKLNNVVLIRLSPDAVGHIEGIIREKRFVDNSGVLNDKIMAVSFGKDLPQGWLPSGVQRRTRDQKDFCFGFEDESKLTVDDFQSGSAHGKMNAIVRALVAVH